MDTLLQHADFSYNLLPASWLFCFLDNCPNADHCMRYLSGKHIPKHKTFGQSVFPIVLKNAQCEHFKCHTENTCCLWLQSCFSGNKAQGCQSHPREDNGLSRKSWRLLPLSSWRKVAHSRTTTMDYRPIPSIRLHGKLAFRLLR